MVLDSYSGKFVDRANTETPSKPIEERESQRLVEVVQRAWAQRKPREVVAKK